MEYWQNVYSRSRWQDDYELVMQFEKALDAADFVKKYADKNPALEVCRNSVCGQYLFDNDSIVLEGRIKYTCRDYEAYYKNSGGRPPVHFPDALKDWAIGFDSDFVHRVD